MTIAWCGPRPLRLQSFSGLGQAWEAPLARVIEGEWYGKQWCGSGRGTTLYYGCVWLHEGGNSFSLVDVSDEQEANL